MNLFEKGLQRKLLSLILIGIIVEGFIGFINVTHVSGQPSITLKWRKNAGTSSTWMGPLAADLNNDGLMEIVITARYGIAALDPISGNVIWSQPYGGDHVPFEIIDLNKDGIPEILLGPQYINGSSGGVLALHGNNGSVYWYNRNAACKGTYIAVADINADGYPEIYSATPGKITALTYDGRIFASTYTYYPCWGGLTVGDTDFDGVFEVYLGERSDWYPDENSPGRGLRAFWADNLTEIWAHTDILCSSQAPVLADVDKDGDLEIIILSQRGGVAVINTDGSVNTYKGIYRKELRISGLTAHSNPTVADLDGDGNLELITNGNANHYPYPPKIWDLVDWKLDATLPFPSMEPPGVADIDGDGKLEIIAPNQNNVTIFKYNPATTNYDIIYTIPIAMAHEFSITQDIDADGKLELVFNQHNSWVSVYDVEAPTPTPKPRSELYFYSQYRTRVPVYVPPPGPQAPKITEISPNDTATKVSVTLSQLSFKLTDYHCDPINYTVTTNPDIGSTSGINVPNGKITIPVSGLAYSTTYTWTVTATDGTHTTTETFTFTTIDLSPWYNADWRYRKTIMIDHTKVAADQTNFPVLIDLTDTDLKTKAQLDGADILFTDQNKVKLGHEIEQYDSTTGRLIAWVNIPYLSSTTNTILYMYYGNPTCENQQNQTAVWDENYKLVLHLNENTGIHYDSTINGNDGTPFGSLVQGAAGAIGSCVEFNGGYVELPRVCTSEVQFTFSAWIYARSGARYFISEWWSYQGAFLQVSLDGNNIQFYVNNILISRSITLNNWYYVVGTFDGATARLYVNDGSPASTSASNPIWPSQNMYIGDRSDHNRKFNGFIDEVRVSNIVRNAAWTLTKYNNQLNPAAFYTVCPEETLPGEPIISDPDPTNGATNVPITLTDLSLTLTDHQNNLMNYTVTTDPDIGLGSQENVINGRYSITISSLEYARTYTWTVTATDGTHITERTFTFTTETGLLIVDPQFDDSTDSIDLRANSPDQDWYESRGAFSGGDPTLLTLDTSNIGGNTGKKAALKNYGISSNAYLTQEFSSPQTSTFTVSFDIYIDRIQNNGNYDRVGHIYIGDDSATTNAPTGQASERFVLLAFYDPTPGDTGTDLELRARTLNTAAQSWSNTALWVQVATGLSYDTWYTIKIVVNVASQTYDVYINGILAKDGISKMDVYPSSNPIRYMTFASDSDGRGDFYVDNVFSPAKDRYKLAINTVGDGSVERNPGESSYAPGTNITLTAVPADGWIFSEWTGDLTSNENPTSIIMDTHKSVTATFTEGPPPPSYDDVIFDSNFDMGNLINVTYQSGNTDGYRYYTAATNYTTVSFADKHWWFYFSMENVTGKTITISIVNGTEADYSTSQTAGNRWPEIEPVYSYDNINWYRVPLSDVTFNRAARTFTINVTVPIEYDKIWLAPLPPYNIAKRDALFEEFASSPYLTVTSLGTSPGGQELKVATITDPAYPDAGKFKSYVIAQQHSGEVPGSWNAEGLIRFLLSDDPTAAAIRRSYIFRIVPIVNVDGVYYGVSRYTPLRGGVQYDLNRWWNTNPITNAPFEVRVIYQDIQAFQPNSFNDMHSTINTEQVSPKEALTYTWSTTNTDFTNFMNRIRDGGWPETVRAISTLSGGAFQNVHSRLGVTFSLSWENPHDELSSNPGVRLTVNDWMTWGEGWAKGNYLYFGDVHATLTVTSVGSGSVAKNPDAATYAYGTSVQLTATASDGYTFSHWEGDLTGNNNPATILMNGNKTVTAVFIESEYTLTINLEGGGTVSRNYTGPYYYGSVVQLTAIADPHWTFSEWSGDLTGTENPTIIVITGDMNITAHFTGQKYTITASVAGIGGTIQPSGAVIVTYGQDQTFIITPDTGYHVSDVMIDGSSIGPTTSYTFYSVDNNHTITAVFAQNEYVLTIHVIGDGSIAKSPDKTLYTHGEIVELTATANSGYEFSGWSGDLIGADNPAYITMIKNMSITAHFTLNQYVINASVSGTGGTIEPSGLVTLTHGEDITFTITPYTGYHILNLLVDGEYKGAIPTYTFYAVDMNHTITAFFAPNEYTLTVNVSPEGSGTVILNNTGPYYYGDVVQLTAEPNTGWYFSQWEGDIIGSQNPAIIIIDGDKSITALFTQEKLILNVTIIGKGSVNKEPDKTIYTRGETVTLTAIAGLDWTFSGWSGDLTGLVNPATITMTGNITITATFTMNQWWCRDWQYRRTITIDRTKVSGTLTDSPVLIEILDSSLIGKTQPNGYDFVFTDANNVKLNHQIEFYDSTIGHLIVWGKVPYLSSTADTTIYMYYGNPNCENQQNQTAVWDTNYMLVLHLNENTGTLYDSTINGNNGTPFKGVLQGVTGKIDGAVTFDPGLDYIEIPHSDTLAGYTEAFTVSFWIRLEDTSRRQTILCKYDTSGNMRSWQIEYDPLNRPNNPFWFFASQDGITYREWWASFVPQANTWYYVTVVWEANTIPKFYINGMQVPTVGTATISSIFNNSGIPLHIGRSIYAGRYFKGSLDEIRISNIARSADWILTTYNNQFNPTTVYSLGAEETFQEAYILTLHIDGNGSITITPEKTAYTQGEIVTLTATPGEGYEFQGWSGDLTGTDNPATITITGNMNITAHFTLNQYVINASVSGTGGTIEPSGLVTLTHGEDITFTITPYTGYHVLDVLVDGESQGPISTYTFYAVDMNHTITVIFAPDEY